MCSCAPTSLRSRPACGMKGKSAAEVFGELRERKNKS